MTNRELLSKLGKLTEEQLDREVILYFQSEDQLTDYEITDVRTAPFGVPGLISKDTPYLVVEGDVA
jgi:hypothetical protein